MANTFPGNHSHVFLGEGHERNERRTWMVIALCTVMMIAEIAGGWIFGSIALIADGLHMSTHASALLLAAVAYSYARRHAEDERFSFGTGKLGDLAGFTSAVVLVMIAVLIGYEAVSRLIWPVHIDFNEAMPIAVLGLAVNVASVLLCLAAGGTVMLTTTAIPTIMLTLMATSLTIARMTEDMRKSRSTEHAHGAAARDNNMRSAVVHVLADAGVSVLVIVALLLGRFLGWSWMDPVVGLGRCDCHRRVVLHPHSRYRRRPARYPHPDRSMAKRMREMIETDGDRLTDLHVWRLGPRAFGRDPLRRDAAPARPGILSGTAAPVSRALSHVTVQVHKQ